MPKLLIVSLAFLLSSTTVFAACQSYTDSNGNITTYCPEGVYHTDVYRNGDSTTYGPNGTTQTYVDSTGRSATSFGASQPVPALPRSHIDPITGKWRD